MPGMQLCLLGLGGVIHARKTKNPKRVYINPIVCLLALCATGLALVSCCRMLSRHSIIVSCGGCELRWSLQPLQRDDDFQLPWGCEGSCC